MTDVNYGLVTLAAGNSVGVSKVVFKNGLSATYIHPDVKNQVKVPDNYFDSMLYELNKAQEYSSKANAQAQTAKKCSIYICIKLVIMETKLMELIRIFIAKFVFMNRKLVKLLV